MTVTVMLAATSAFVSGGCSDWLVDGDFAGDATIHLHGTAQLAGGNPERARVGALWLGYSAAVSPYPGIETTALPVSSIGFPPSFVFDVLTAPPSAGRYATADSRIIPALVRFARFILFDDRDGDGAFVVDAAGALVPPDRLLARAGQHLLLFVAQPPAEPATLDGVDALVTDWQDAAPGYQVVALDPTIAAPDFAGHIVSNETTIVFLPPVAETVF